MSVMGKALRRIADPVVATAPAGVRIRTRLHVSEDEAAALTAIGQFLGSVYRGELADRIGCGGLDREGRAVWRARRKQALTAVSSSRWAGAITRAVEDQYRLGMRGVAAHVADLGAAVGVLEARCALRPGELAPPDDGVEAGAGARSRRRRGYRSVGERFAKTRRLAVLRDRLATAEAALAAGRPSIVVGGKRLWRNRNHLEATGMTEQQWRDRWDAARLFLTADGESGKAGGNETIRVDEAGRLRVKTPAALVGQFGSHVVIGAPIRFNHRGDEWEARVSTWRAVRYDISFDPARGRWYIDASWKATAEPAPELDGLRQHRVLGVDLNDGHLATCVLDSSGNPVDEPVSIDVTTAGLRASHRDGRARAAITAVLDHAQQHNCSAVVVENLDFADARATGRDTLARGKRGKSLRRTIAGIPTRRFRDRLISMAARRGIAVIGVDPAYTSKWGNQHWRKPLQQQTSDPSTVTGHHGAAAAIGRRGLGLAIRRRPAGPRTRQRTSVGTPPTRPDHHPSTTHCGCGSSGPPTHPPRGVPDHRKTPTGRGQHRSAAQDSLTNQERFGCRVHPLSVCATMDRWSRDTSASGYKRIPKRSTNSPRTRRHGRNGRLALPRVAYDRPRMAGWRIRRWARCRSSSRRRTSSACLITWSGCLRAKRSTTRCG
jgi:IS605 OrfB family transposase